MKTKQQKYQEAVERNLANASKRPKARYAYAGTVARLRTHMGIRKTDHSHDAVLACLLRA